MKKNTVIPAVKRIVCVLLLILSLAATFRTAWIVSTTLLDSDTSSELVLGEKLAREGGIMSTTWNYSTELQVIDSQIVYSLLFRLTGDWSLVRFWGSVIMDLMMLGAYAYLSRQAGIPFNRFCLSGAALMLPFSIPYGRIVLYHNYYSFHITFSFLIVGLYLGARRRMGQKKKWPFRTTVALLAATAFAACLTGVRDLMISIVPLAVTAVLCAMMAEQGTEKGSRLRREMPGMLLAAVPLAAGAAGYMVNLHAFANRYTFQDFSTQTISMGNFGDLHTVIYNTFVDLGFQDFQPLFSLEGLLGIGGIVAWMLSVFLAFHTMRHTEDPASRFLQVFWLIVQLIMACVFLFLTGAELLHLLYLLPIVIWILPAFASADTRIGCGAAAPEAAARPAGRRQAAKRAKGGLAALLTAGDAPVSVHGMLSIVGCLLLIAGGLFYTGFFRDPAAIRLEYTGLQYNDTGTVKGLQPIAEYLTENGYTMAYGTYWDAAVITELSDGKVKTVPVETGTHKHPIKYLKWLSDTNLWNPELVAGEKVALVANMELTYALEDFAELGAEELTSISGRMIYDLPDPAALARDLD